MWNGIFMTGSGIFYCYFKGLSPTVNFAYKSISHLHIFKYVYSPRIWNCADTWFQRYERNFYNLSTCYYRTEYNSFVSFLLSVIGYQNIKQFFLETLVSVGNFFSKTAGLMDLKFLHDLVRNICQVTIEEIRFDIFDFYSHSEM